MSNISIVFHVSEECRKNEAAKTGQTGAAERTLTVDLSDLSQAKRKAILAIASVEADGNFELRLAWDRNKMLVLRDEPRGYSHDEDGARSDNWLDRQELIFDEMPTVEILINRISEMLVAKREAQEAAEKLAEPYQAKVAATQAAAEENEQRHQAEYERMRPILEKLIAADDYDAVNTASCVPGSVNRPDWYDFSFHSHGENSLAHLQTEACQAIRRKRGEAEKSNWIEAHSSEHLKRAFAMGYDCQRMYVLERAALEAPGFSVDFNNNAEWKSRSCPSTEALDEAEAAQKFNIGEPSVAWLTSPATERHDDCDDEPFEPTEAVVIKNYLGKYDLVKII